VSKENYNITRLHEPDLSLFDWGRGQRIPARTSDPETSILAAESIDPTEREAEVLEILRAHPEGLTEAEVADRLPHRDRVSVSPRFRPLRRKGKIREAGERVGASGRKARVWVIV